MANNYSQGTLITNFNSNQIKEFQKWAYVHQSVETGQHDSESDALKAYKRGDGYDIFENDGGFFWNMESFDCEAARYAAHKVFDRHTNARKSTVTDPNSELYVQMDVAFTCSKPRPGEFGGLNEILTPN